MSDVRSGTLVFVSVAPGDALRAARRLAERSALVTPAQLTWQLQHIDDQLNVDPHDTAALCSAVTEYSRRHPISGIVTFDERAVVQTAILQRQLRLPGNTPESAEASRNKYLMRSRFSQAGLTTPAFSLVRSCDEAVRLANERLAFPLVLKPLFGTASEGVLRVNDVAELEVAFPVVTRIASAHQEFVDDRSFSDCLLLETYLPGAEVAVDGFVIDGKFLPVGVWDKADPLEGPTFLETIYVSPSALAPDAVNRVLAEVSRGVAALGLTVGPVHAELRLTAQGPVLLEIGARAIGGACGRAHSNRLGFDYFELALRASLGLPIDAPLESRTPSGVMMIPPPSRGRLEGVEGIEAARGVAGVRDLFLVSKPGDMLVGLPDSGCYVGFIFAMGESQGEVIDRLKESHGKLNFRVTPA
jgi:biotin carboxylase